MNGLLSSLSDVIPGNRQPKETYHYLEYTNISAVDQKHSNDPVV